MKGDWNAKKFLALFMAVAMVMASGIFVTTQSFKATDDEYYEADESEDMESVDADEEDYEEEEVEIDEEDSEDEEDFDEEEADEETADAEDEESDEEAADAEDMPGTTCIPCQHPSAIQRPPRTPVHVRPTSAQSR